MGQLPEGGSGDAVADVVVGRAVLGAVVSGVGLVGVGVGLIAVRDLVQALRVGVCNRCSEVPLHAALQLDVECVIGHHGVGLCHVDVAANGTSSGIDEALPHKTRVVASETSGVAYSRGHLVGQFVLSLQGVQEA